MASRNSKSQCHKKVKIFYTGGTIGMQKNQEGAYAPKENALKDRIRATAELHNEEEAKKIRCKEACGFDFLLKHTTGDCIFLYDVEEYDPLLDSSNMAQEQWIMLAKDIMRDYQAYDGFVVLHGTDTMAYTASALSFMLEGLRKAVILTGAMIPIFEIRSDAVNNIVCSLLLAGCYNIPEVAVFSGNKLLRGNRTSKISAECLLPFDTRNYPPLAFMDTNEEVHYRFILKPNPCQSGFYIQDSLSKDVIVLPIYPGIKPSTLAEILRAPVEGVVLQCFGAGNIPSDPEIIRVFENAVKKNILIVRITLCQQGSVSDAYECGLILSKAGVVPGFDMTVEAAYTKLCWVLAKSGMSFYEKCQVMKSNIRGELTC